MILKILKNFSIHSENNWLKKKWGKNWNAFNDILKGGFVKTEYEEPFRLTWKNSHVSRNRLEDFNDIVDLIGSHKHIELVLQ
jgi:RNAse (barnase) inhibitor barstar